VSRKMNSDRKFHYNVVPGSAVRTEHFHVATIMPVILSAMGRLGDRL